MQWSQFVKEDLCGSIFNEQTIVRCQVNLSWQNLGAAYL